MTRPDCYGFDYTKKTALHFQKPTLRWGKPSVAHTLNHQDWAHSFLMSAGVLAICWPNEWTLRYCWFSERKMAEPWREKLSYKSFIGSLTTTLPAFLECREIPKEQYRLRRERLTGTACDVPIVDIKEALNNPASNACWFQVRIRLHTPYISVPLNMLLLLVEIP